MSWTPTLSPPLPMSGREFFIGLLSYSLAGDKIYCFRRSFGISLWEVGTFAQWPYFDLSNEEVIDTVQSSQECVLENPFQPLDQLSPL